MSNSVGAPQLLGDALGAVNHRGSHLQIIAAAGSGKTEVVSQRIVSLIADGVASREIVGFTFTEKAAEELKEGKSTVICEKGNLVKVSKDKDGKIKKEILTKKWHDWIDYWAVDFDYESRKEIIKRAKGFGDKGEKDVYTPEDGSFVDTEEVWSGNYIFENEWQSFRTKKDRGLELTSTPHECTPGRRKIAIKVVDIFGNDTMTIIDINVPSKS